jgi:hypothetical protein
MYVPVCIYTHTCSNDFLYAGVCFGRICENLQVYCTICTHTYYVYMYIYTHMLKRFLVCQNVFWQNFVRTGHQSSESFSEAGPHAAGG